MSEDPIGNALQALGEIIEETKALRRRRDELTEALNHAVTHLEFHGHGGDAIMQEFRSVLAKENEAKR